MTCSPRTAPLEHVDFRIPPGVHAVSVARRQTSVGLVEDDAWQGRRWSMFVRLAPTLSFGTKSEERTFAIYNSQSTVWSCNLLISRGRHQHLWPHSLSTNNNVTTVNMVARRREVAL